VWGKYRRVPWGERVVGAKRKRPFGPGSVINVNKVRVRSCGFGATKMI
jgi:hypothetical protein